MDSYPKVIIETPAGNITINQSNLLHNQIAQEIKGIIESKINTVDFLRHLQEIRKNGLPKPIN